MKVYNQLLLGFALGATAQQASPPSTMQPPLHTFPPVIVTTALVSSDASLPTTLGAKATGTSTASASGSSGRRTSTGLAVPTAQLHIAPILGIAAAAVIVL